MTRAGFFLAAGFGRAHGSECRGQMGTRASGLDRAAGAVATMMGGVVQIPLQVGLHVFTYPSLWINSEFLLDSSLRTLEDTDYVQEAKSDVVTSLFS